MMLKNQIMKLQTYKMYEGEDTVYVERDDVLKILEQQPCEDMLDKIIAQIEQTRDKDKIAEYPYNRCIRIVEEYKNGE